MARGELGVDEGTRADLERRPVELSRDGRGEHLTQLDGGSFGSGEDPLDQAVVGERSLVVGHRRGGGTVARRAAAEEWADLNQLVSMSDERARMSQVAIAVRRGARLARSARATPQGFANPGPLGRVSAVWPSVAAPPPSDRLPWAMLAACVARSPILPDVEGGAPMPAEAMQLHLSRSMVLVSAPGDSHPRARLDLDREDVGFLEIRGFVEAQLRTVSLRHSGGDPIPVVILGDRDDTVFRVWDLLVRPARNTLGAAPRVRVYLGLGGGARPARGGVSTASPRSVPR